MTLRAPPAVLVDQDWHCIPSKRGMGGLGLAIPSASLQEHEHRYFALSIEHNPIVERPSYRRNTMPPLRQPGQRANPPTWPWSTCQVACVFPEIYLCLTQQTKLFSLLSEFVPYATFLTAKRRTSGGLLDKEYSAAFWQSSQTCPPVLRMLFFEFHILPGVISPCPSTVLTAVRDACRSIACFAWPLLQLLLLVRKHPLIHFLDYVLPSMC